MANRKIGELPNAGTMQDNDLLLLEQNGAAKKLTLGFLRSMFGFLPQGGTAGQVLTKTETGASWQDAKGGLPVPETATVGQVIAVKSVDGNGKITAVEAVDMPAGGSLGVFVTPALTASWAMADGAGLTPMEIIESISAVYEGGDVAAGTAVADLTGIAVTATYIDGSTLPITDYTLSGEITEGENIITVNYYSYTATFTVNGVAETEVSE